MFSMYKGLILFVLIANTLALPIKKDGSNGKMVVFEKIRTVLNCVCYYEEGQTLDNDKLDEYCDCTPEKVESDKDLVDESEVDSLKKANGIFVHGEGDENLSDVQKFGSADSAFFDNLEENEAKEDEENNIPLIGKNDKYIKAIDDEIDNEIDEGEADVDGTVEDIPEYNSVNEEIISNDNKKFVVDLNGDGNTVTESENIYDEDGNLIQVQVEMVGEAYEEEDNGEDDENDENVESRPTITRENNSNRKILDELDGPLVGSDAKYVINYYNENEEFDDEAEEIEMEDDDDDGVDDNDEFEEEGFIEEEVEKYKKGNEKYMVSLDNEVDNANEENNEEEGFIEEEVEKYKKADNEDDDDSTYDHINENDDLRTVYKKLVIKKLKSDIKNMDSEKLIASIIKEAIQNNDSNNNNPLKEILN